MKISFRSKALNLAPEVWTKLEEKFTSVERLLGEDALAALLELDIERAPAEGRSAEPYRLVANLSFKNTVLHAEAVKPSPESAADRVRNELDHEIRRTRNKGKSLLKRGRAAVKDFLRFGK